MNASAASEDDNTIILLLNDWSSQIVLTHITSEVLQHMGYQTKFEMRTTDLQWGILGRGMAHIQMEVWQGTMEEPFTRLVNNKAILDAGQHDAFTREEWWYPIYMEKLCPGLPNWRALKKCAHLFSNAKSNGKGVYLGGPWEKPDAARIRALAMPFIVQKVDHADELWPRLNYAYNKEHPIILFNWTPNWIEAQYMGKFVEFPEYHPDCEKLPEWGENKDFLHDCGNPKNGWLKKAIWAQLPEKWPCAYEIVQNINFNNQMLSQLAFAVDYKKMSYQKVANEWLTSNKKLWQSWLPKNCQLSNN